MSEPAILNPTPALTAKAIIAVLRKNHEPPQYAFFEELRCGTGATPGADADQRLDAWCINCWPMHRLARTAYEVKISRADYLLELKHPRKRRRALLLSNLFYFVAPKGLLREDELPVEAGLIEVLPDDYGYLRAHTRVQAPWRDTPMPNWQFVANLARLAATNARRP
ncbi:hypothetical protein [Devosia sp.]|uniref:hypothetical protein n=1 Tax=Devosia sp. TaxID=1871048 RepID=UPI002735ECBC|nr:hypothetical protein [Devosia sp.]MDP2779753.1 hypothetical protein [Devosia sp.]